MEELSDRFRWKVLTHLLPQSPRAWTERTALHSKGLAAREHLYSLFQQPEEKPG